MVKTLLRLRRTEEDFFSNWKQICYILTLDELFRIFINTFYCSVINYYLEDMNRRGSILFTSSKSQSKGRDYRTNTKITAF